jgi:hypothetical protein
MEMDVTFCKCNCQSFILYLPYASLTSYSTRQLQISNGVSYLWQMVCARATEDAVLDILEGSAGRGWGRGQVPCDNARLPPRCMPVSIEQLMATKNNLMSVLVQNEAHHGAGRP